MNALASLYTSEPYNEPDTEARASLARIDASVRNVGLLFLVASVVWLMIGTLLALLASFTLHPPNFIAGAIADIEWLTFGRVRSAHLNAMAFGWGNNAIFLVAIWLMARLSRTEIRHQGMLYIAAIFWNVAVLIGVWGILAGDITSVEWLEMPTYVTPLVAFSYALIGVWGILAFANRQTDHVYVSQWYLLAAFFWFPWLYTIIQIMIFFEPARGVVQALANWWFAHNVLGLWFTPVGLAAAYYFIPKVLGRPIYSYYLSILGFWSLALFYNWAGVHHLIGGPVPAWVISAGTVGSVMMVIPVVVTAINHHMTVVGPFRPVIQSPTLLFTVFGAISYTLVSLLGSAMALRSVNEITHFTHFTVGHAHHGVYAFFTMIMFGSIYYILPRLVGKEWPSAALIRIHFWFTALGISLMLFALHAGGWLQGVMMADREEVPPFLEIVEFTKPWLWARSVSGLMLTVGHIAFGISVFWMLLKKPTEAEKEQGPTLLASPAELKAES